MCLGVPGKIIEIYENSSIKMGKVDFGGVIREVCLEYVPEAKIGDYTIIHVGFAISLINEEDARVSLETLREIVELEEELGIGVAESDQLNTSSR
ncbi:MAG: HypC/HybG/HupF family hydrogenase formation chaperone [Anaerolineales bacterium]|jgi:hydrogenase expression/formation protein HypC